MKIPQPVLDALKNEVDLQGIAVVTKRSGINYRTVMRLMDTGECHRPPYLKLIKFLKRERQQRKKDLEVLTD